MPHKTRLITLAVAVATVTAAATTLHSRNQQTRGGPPTTKGLVARQNAPAGTIVVTRAGSTAAVVTQNAPPDARPFLHPIAAPDGRGVLTESSPTHHPHQTGLYWGFTRLNGRDYFHNRGADYWRRVSATVLQASGDEVRWQTVYDLIDENGAAILTETERWSMREQNGRFLLDLTWRGEARRDVTIGKYDYGGLFLRMPWRQGIDGEVVNAARQRNARAEGQRAMWVDVAMRVEGRDDRAHIAIFDHPDNGGYPQPWRVDDQLGVGTARARAADWSIPANQTEVIRHRFVVYTGTLDDVEMTNAWTEYSGNRSTYSTAALWGIAQQEGRAATFLSPQEAAANMTTVPGYKVNAWAGEPMVTQPMAFCWDDRGRLWVAENRDYETRAQGFSNAGDSRIVILEDTDHDGVADSRKVFLEGIPFPAAIAVGFDGLFLGAPPNLLFVPDRNGDDKADMADIEVRLTGWGISDRHETINSLHWGPDGWLYGLQGYATTSKVRKPEGKGRLYAAKEPFPSDLLQGPGVEMNGGVWRYHPTKDRFEVVAHGFSNPWGIDYDAKGQLVISACVIPHLWHVIPGGIYHRQGGQHFNPYVYSDIQTIADHRHRSAHGGARIYQSDAFPASQAGRVFMANIHEHAVLSDVLERKGSGFTAHHGEDFALANNAQWIGFSVEIGPDGNLYVLDWHDGDICGQGITHKETGRIFRIAPAQSLAKDWDGRYGDLKALSDAELVQLQTSASDWHARRARVILQARASSGKLSPAVRQQLRELFIKGASPDWRLRAMWTLHVTGLWTPDTLVQIFDDSDEYIRAWAVQLITEDGTPSQPVLDTFLRLAREDPSPVVRLYLASALQRIAEDQRWPIASALMARGEDAGDHNLPKILWLAVEPLVRGNPALALEHAGRSNIPMLAQFIARRAVDADNAGAVVAEIGKTPKSATALLEGLRDGLQGRVDVTAPADWPALQARLRRAGGRTAELTAEVAQQFGDTEAVRRNLATVRNERAATDDRKRALQVLAGQRRTQLVDELPAMLGSAPLRLDAIRAVAAFDNERLGRLLIEQYPGFSPAERAEALQTMASRPRYGRMLTEAIAKGVVSRSDVPASLPRQLLRVVGTPFLDVWGPVERSATDERAYARYRAVLNDNAMARADLTKGRALFRTTCGSCHRLNGEGGTVGPDLTGTNRVNANWLLLNVLEPNADVQDAYKMTVVTTRDGRTYSGSIAAETDRQLTLRVIAGDQKDSSVIVNKADIQSRETTAASMMPPGLLDTLTDSEVVDLMAYVRHVETAPSATLKNRLH
jgi:putative membrane-bound dehydrogenase-like protein